MARQNINTGSRLGDRTGDDGRVVCTKINENFTELYLGGYYPQTPAELAAGITPTAYQYEPGDVRRYGADPTGVSDSSTAIQSAINVAINQAEVGGDVYLPEGNYRVNTTLSIGSAVNGIRLRGAGADATRLTNGITGSAAHPCILINVLSNYHVIEGLLIAGNGLTTSGGNGNAISLINPGGVLGPNVVCIRDVVIRDHSGTGRNESGASMEAAGLFAYDLTALTLRNVYITGCDYGFRGDTIEDCSLHGVLIDDCALNGIYLEDSFAISHHGVTVQSCGSNGSTDGCFYPQNCENISFFGGEMKNGWPYLINTQGSTQVNHNILFSSVALAQLDDTMGHTCVRVNNATTNLAFEHCRLEFVNTITDGKGIEVIQAASGWSTSGLRIVGNSFKVGSGGTIAACVHLNVTSNRICAPLIQSNEFGWQDSTGSATAITDAILLEGKVEGGLIQANTFITATNVTITDCIDINSSAVVGLQVRNNEYQGFGTTTNQVNNAAGVSFERNERVSGSLLTGSNTWNPGSIADGDEEEKIVGVTGAVLGDFVEGVSFSLDIQDLELTAAVTAADTVSCTLSNNTGGAVDLGSGTVRVRVRKFQ